jgi:acyl-CoA reductase-like NAD-dependent aldehyde dehydrogenase
LTRVLVPAQRDDAYVDALAAEMTNLRVGDPSDPGTQLGPLVSQRQQSRVRNYIEIGQREGARLVVGGAGMPDGVERGWYHISYLAEVGMAIHGIICPDCAWQSLRES